MWTIHRNRWHIRAIGEEIWFYRGNDLEGCSIYGVNGVHYIGLFPHSIHPFQASVAGKLVPTRWIPVNCNASKNLSSFSRINQTKIFPRWVCSSLLNRNKHTLLGFYVDWTIQACGSIGHLYTLIAAAMFHIGMCFYINRLLEDLAKLLDTSYYDTLERNKRKITDGICLHAETTE